MKTPFLVIGIGYIILALATMVLGLAVVVPAIITALQQHASGIQLVPLVILSFIFLFFVLFYLAIGIAVLRKRWRQFVVIGACISCIFLPFGTILGVLFLCWTRRDWKPIEERT
jgi:hypothetical protein